MNIFKTIGINYKWRFFCFIFTLTALIALMSTGKQINIDAINPTTITSISIMFFGVLFPILKEADEKSGKKYEFKQNIKKKIARLNELLKEHKTIEVLGFRTLLNKGFAYDIKKNNLICDLFSKEYFLEIDKVKKEYNKLFWQTITQNEQVFSELVSFSFLDKTNERNQNEDIKEDIKYISHLFFESKKNIFRRNNQVQNKINQLKSVKYFNHESQAEIDKEIMFFEARIKYIRKFGNVFAWIEGYVKSSSNLVFGNAFLTWRYSVFKNCLYIYLTVIGDNKYDNQILNKYIEEFDIGKKNYYSFSHFQKNQLLDGIKDRFVTIGTLVIKKHIKSFAKIYKKSFFKVNESGGKRIPMSKGHELILNQEHPKILEELIDFNQQSEYLGYSFTVELPNMKKGISLAMKVSGCMDMIEQIVEKENFNEKTRQKILKNMYLFQKDRINEFEDFLNMLLFQEDNKLEIENLTNNLITKNQKDNQTIS